MNASSKRKLRKVIHNRKHDASLAENFLTDDLFDIFGFPLLAISEQVEYIGRRPEPKSEWSSRVERLKSQYETMEPLELSPFEDC